MNKIVFFFSIMILSCSSMQKEADLSPKISSETMVLMITDFAIADAIVENEMLPRNQEIYQKKIAYYEAIFEKYGFNAQDFEESYIIYSKDIEQMNLMYDKALEDLSLKELELTK